MTYALRTLVHRWLAVLILLYPAAQPVFGQHWVQAQRVTPNQSFPDWPHIEQTVADAAGNLYVTGGYSGTFIVGNTTLSNNTGRPYGFVGKINPAGQWVWVVGTSTANAAQGHSGTGQSVALDPMGNVLVAFLCSGTKGCRFGGRTVVGPGSNVFVASLTNAGSLRWATAPSTTSLGLYSSGGKVRIAADSNGNVWLAGSMHGRVTFGTTTFTPTAAAEMFVARLSPSGAWQWVRNSTGSSGFDTGAGGNYNLTRVDQLVVDGRGSATILGYFANSIQLGNFTLTRQTTYNQDLFVCQLDSAGTWQWATHTESPGSTTTAYTILAGGLTVTTNNETWLTGYHQVPTVFGSTQLTPAPGNMHGFLARIGPGGQWLGAASLDDSLATQSGSAGLDLIADASGGAWMLGDSVVRRHVTRFTPFVAKYAPQGTELWRVATRCDTAVTSYLWGGRLTAASNGNLIYTSEFSGEVHFGNHPVILHDTVGIVMARLHDNPLATPAEVGTHFFSLFPNPAHHTVTLTGAPSPTAEIVDALGRTVRTLPLEPQPSNLLDLRGLTPGLYVVRAGGLTRRLVVE